MEQILEYPKIEQGKTKFIKNVVRLCKNLELKTRLRTLISERGMSEVEFYEKLDLSRQVWYDISWGRWEINAWLKIKIAAALGVDSRVIWP